MRSDVNAGIVEERKSDRQEQTGGDEYLSGMKRIQSRDIGYASEIIWTGTRLGWWIDGLSKIWRCTTPKRRHAL